MYTKLNETVGSISFLNVICILFIVLKLFGYITWSWVWILSPLWIPPAIIVVSVFVFAVIVVFLSLIAFFLGGIDEIKRN